AYFEAAKQLIKDAKKSIDLVLFKITRYSSFGGSESNLLTEELVKARKRGVKVRIVLDVNTWSEEINQSNRETALWLLGKGIEDVKFDSREVTTHSKVMVVDGESVLVGSSNWSYYSLAENLEMDVVIKKLPSVARSFETYFEEVWRRAEIPSREELSGTP
ncbi:MAG: phospholipase D-like domain-containing protein, partial [Candidatus Bipolaricaulia bacterium]